MIRSVRAPLPRRPWGGACLWLAAALAFALCSAPPPSARADAASAPPGPNVKQEVKKVIDQLQAEANNLDELDNPKPAPVFERPVDGIGDWDDAHALAALAQVTRSPASNPYRQAYVNYHILYAVQAYFRRRYEQFNQTGHFTPPPKDVIQQLKKLASTLPSSLYRPHRTSRIRVPKDIYSQYSHLRAQTKVTVGVPPFIKTYHGRKAIRFFPPAQRDRIRQICDRLDVLRKKFHTIKDEEAVRYNKRLDSINHMVRDYQGEVIYTITQSGDPSILGAVVDAIRVKAREHQRLAFDMVAFLYNAGYQGYLRMYPPDKLKQFGSRLEQVGRATEGYFEPKWGTHPQPPWMKPQARNFADYVFTLVHQLKEPSIYVYLNQKVHVPEGDRAAPAATHTVTPENLTTADIRAARRRAIRAISTQDGLQPNYIPLATNYLQYILTRSRNTVRYQEVLHGMGNQALASWAMLAAGHTYQDPRLFKRVNWVLSQDTPFTYDRGMRLLMLAQMPPERWSQWTRRDARWLGDALTKDAGFPYQYVGKPPKYPWGNHADAQYGLLGLWAAQRAGYHVNDRVWRAIDRQWRATQQKTPGDKPAGWALGMLNVDTGGAEASKKVTGAMTAGGVAALALTERMLQRNGGDAGSSRALRKGLAWLNQHFDYHKTGFATDWAFYMWTMQRVGQATGYRTFNGVDWFRQVTAELINRQEADGTWHTAGSNFGRVVSTSFALLYLGSAMDPVAISKLRFDGKWNNHPADLWNFTDRASDRYETDTIWQIIEPEKPVYQLIESPLLYLSTDSGFKLSDKAVDHLRRYIRAGGLLLMNAEAVRPKVLRSEQNLAKRLFPDQEMRQVKPDNPLLHIHAQVKPAVRMRMIDNGVRPQVIMFTRDIDAQLEADIPTKKAGPAFNTLSNLYLFAVGMRPQRPRLSSTYLPAAQKQAGPTRTIARIQPKGAKNLEPAADSQLQAFMAKRLQTHLVVHDRAPSALGGEKLALLAMGPGQKLTDAQAAAIGKWVRAGGTLWLDAVGGSEAAADAAYAAAARIAPHQPIRALPDDSPIITGQGLAGGYDNTRVQYRLHSLRRMGPTASPRLQVIRVDGRPAIIVSGEDLTAGLAGLHHWSILGYDITTARHLVANGILAATSG